MSFQNKKLPKTLFYLLPGQIAICVSYEVPRRDALRYYMATRLPRSFLAQ